jgi:hypothetical protein
MTKTVKQVKDRFIITADGKNNDSGEFSYALPLPAGYYKSLVISFRYRVYIRGQVLVVIYDGLESKYIKIGEEKVQPASQIGLVWQFTNIALAQDDQVKILAKCVEDDDSLYLGYIGSLDLDREVIR